jgi:hypothetical protein
MWRVSRKIKIMLRIATILFSASGLFLSACSVSEGAERTDTTQTDSTLPPPIVIHPTFERFVVKGCVPVDSCFGFLNNDTITDAALLLRDTTVGLGDPAQRPLIVMLGGNGIYTSSFRNDSVVLKEDEGGMLGDPFAGMEIANGALRISHYGGSAWRWSRETVFRYDTAAAQLLLHSDSAESFNINEPNKPHETEKRNVGAYGKQTFSGYSVYR